MSKQFIKLGAVNGFLATGFGAFGAHALKFQLSADMIAVYQTAVNYHFYHSLALVLLGALSYQVNNKYLKYSGTMFCFGITLFSGSLYLLSITGIKILGIITPFGGVAFLLGWLFMMLLI